MQNGVISMGLTAATNRVVMEPNIDKNWKSEDWNKKKKKKWKLERQFYIFVQWKRGWEEKISSEREKKDMLINIVLKYYYIFKIWATVDCRR